MAKKYPNNKKDKWGDLGIVVDGFEIWRSIALLDYDFYDIRSHIATVAACLLEKG